MKLVTTVPSCSWEQKYTFTPRIHRYPGAKGVVRKTWWKKVKKPTDAAVKDETKTDASPKEEDKNKKTETVNREPLTAKVPSVPRKPRSQRPQSALVKTHLAPKEETGNVAPNATVPTKKPDSRVGSAPAKAPVPPTPSPSTTKADADNTNSATPAARAHRFQTNYRPLPPSSLMSAKAETTPTAFKVPTKPKESYSYKPRIKSAYALPPSFETDRRQLEAMLEEPTLMVENGFPPATVPFTSHSSGAQHHFPPSRQALLLDPQYKLKTRAEFLQHLAGEDPYVVTAELREKLGAAPSDATAYCYDYNFNSPDLVNDAWEQRLLAYYRFEDILYDRVVGDVLPLAEAMTKAQQSVQQDTSSKSKSPGTTTAAKDRWVAVRDDGHVCSPIELHPVLPAVSGSDSTRTNGYYYYYDTIQNDKDNNNNNNGEAEYAVLVRPFVDEVATNSAARLEVERRRVVAKGREWDRQYAIRAAVGPTAQEALLDLRVDPRYRRPGEYLLRRNVGVDM